MCKKGGTNHLHFTCWPILLAYGFWLWLIASLTHTHSYT